MPGDDGELWGKERVIATLMRAQRESGDVFPRLITFSPCPLSGALAAAGFPVEVLCGNAASSPWTAFLRLKRSLKRRPPELLHTHGYKANIIGRLAHATGTPMRGLVSTCHGWVESTARTRFYNRIDRATAFASDVVTVTDDGMCARVRGGARCKYIANGIEDRCLASPEDRQTARAQFKIPEHRLAVGMLGRAETAKGVREIVAAARRTAALPIQWLIAGSGPLELEIKAAALPNLTCLGYVSQSARYLEAIDVYLQASHAEGLSLALLEAMRAALPIVATPVGSTLLAVREMREALVVDVNDTDAIISAVSRLMRDPPLAMRLGSAARRRFETMFHVQRQHLAFLNLYRSCDRKYA